MQTLPIKYSPSSAMVLVDNKLVKGSNGVAKTRMPIGQHSFVVACDGYESEEGTVKLKSSAPSNLQITLSKEVASTSSKPQTALPQQAKTQQLVEQNQSITSTVSPSVSSTSSDTVDVSTSGSVITIPVNDGISIEMVKVEAGCFKMGSKQKPTGYLVFRTDYPVHRVTLTNNYYIGKYEVTQALWQAVMGNNPSKFKGTDLPVENVSWNDCQDFISKLNAMTGNRFRLPTEAEWEFAARGGNKSRGYQYSGSNVPSDVAWYRDNSGSKTHAVGTRQSNELGIYDMSGNVWEWCQDWYGSYSRSPQINPTGAISGKYHVIRSDSWYGSAWGCRSSDREDGFSYISGIMGLRLALSE